MQSRIPALDALSAFVPTGHEEDTQLQKAVGARGSSRWFPVEGGHDVLFLYEGGEFDAGIFKIKKGAWDHEHCTACGGNIPPMTLCWVTESGPYVILCGDCYEKMNDTSPTGEKDDD